MFQNLSQRIIVIITSVIGGLFLGCSSVELSTVPQKPLPTPPPGLVELLLEIPPEGGPRRPLTDSATSALRSPDAEIIISDVVRPDLRVTAEHNSDAKEQLGDRFAFIHTEEVPANLCLIARESDRSQSEGEAEELFPSGDLSYRLTYYSYSKNLAVHVCLKDNKVTSVQPDPRQGYQPEEGDEEIVSAIDLARKDRRISEQVQNLHGHAILTSPEEYRYFWVTDEAGFGNRVFWVTFSETDESLPLYFARVDLTSQTILEAGKEPGPQ